MLEGLKRVRRGRLFVVELAMISLTWLVLDFRWSAFGYSQSAADINYATDTLGYWRNEDGWWRGNCNVTLNDNCRINQPWPHGKGRLTAQTFLQGLGAAVVREHGVALLWRLLVGPLLIALSVIYLAPAIAAVFWRWLAPG